MLHQESQKSEVECHLAHRLSAAPLWRFPWTVFDLAGSMSGLGGLDVERTACCTLSCCRALVTEIREASSCPIFRFIGN